MSKNEKGIACNDAPTNKLDQSATKNHTPTQPEFQVVFSQSLRNLLESTKLFKLPERKTSKLPSTPFLETKAFVCDECARPLHLYGENFVESYNKGKVNILRCLCDLHAQEFDLLEVKK